MPGERHSVRALWSVSLPCRFNTVSVGDYFRNPGLHVVIGCEDGIVRGYEMHHLAQSKDHKHTISLETKGGPIQQMSVHDVTKFHSKDILVADSRGTVTVFSNGQIVMRKVVTESCINSMLVLEDALGNLAIVCSDDDGNIIAFNPYNDLWKIRLPTLTQIKGLGNAPVVQCMLPVMLRTPGGQIANYLLVADNCRHLFFLHQGSVVLMLNLPASVNTMCAGKFLDSNEIEGSEGTSAEGQQVALGCESGAIYLMNNFEIYTEEFAHIQLPLKHLRTLAVKDHQQNDIILCAGHFNALVILKHGKEIARHKVSSWIDSITTCDINHDDRPEVIIGCLDNSIHALMILQT